MNQLADLGKALALLRKLHGFSLGECASTIGVTAEQLAATEQGEIDPGDVERIAALYALDDDELREGIIRPVEGVQGATIFLLQGAYADFDARDLDVLERAMRAARQMTALAASSDEGRARLQQRLQFVPTAPAGPMPADAARQGHKLARLLRARLGLGAEPVGTSARSSRSSWGSRWWWTTSSARSCEPRRSSTCTVPRLRPCSRLVTRTSNRIRCSRASTWHTSSLTSCSIRAPRAASGSRWIPGSIATPAWGPPRT